MRKWICNVLRPDKAKEYGDKNSLSYYNHMIKNKVIEVGDPKGTNHISKKDLIDFGVIGLYEIVIELPIPVSDDIPEGYKLIVAYAKEDRIVVPLNTHALKYEELHNCDWEGCSTIHHVIRFSISDKYELIN